MNDYEKAKQYLQIALNSAAQSSDDYGVNQSGFYEVKTAIKAVEKQIPKKPVPHKVEVDRILIGNGYWGKGTTVYKCPNCDEFTTRLYKHCGICGQALDWSDV